MAPQHNLWTMRSLAKALESCLVEVHGDSGAGFGEIITDTRRFATGAVFVAIRGETFDGHDFVQKACELGAGVVIVERRMPVSCPQIVVRDTREAYGALAAAWRSQFAVPVICVVGSNGKTTTTQMIASILRAAVGAEHVLATRGNFNNQIGVPKTLLGFHAGVKAAVVEAGMNHPGEMAQLASWIRPTVVVVTNAQREHQEFLDGVMGAARENAFAIVSLSAKGTAVLPEKDAAYALWRDYARARGCRVATFCEGESATAAVSASEDGAKIILTRRAADGVAQTFDTVLSLSGRHAVHDAAAAAAATLAAGVRIEAVLRGLADFTPVAGRGVRHALKNGTVLIDDAYNANPDSMRAAIDVLSVMSPPRILVVGDMAEVGGKSAEFHAEIGAYAKERGIDRLLAVGAEMKAAVSAFGAGARHYDNVEQLIDAARLASLTQGSIVVKASNSQKLGRVVEALLSDMGRAPGGA